LSGGQLLAGTAATALRQDLALEDPALDADRTGCRASDRSAVFDVRAQRVQRHSAFAIHFLARDFGATEATAGVDTNALRVTAFFIARRNATRRSSWVAMFSATSWAFVSALRTSWMSMNSSFSVMLASSAFSCSTPAPRRPMMMPGRDVAITTFALFAARSIWIDAMPAFANFERMALRSLRSSCSHFA
jgi:hypothetical protein